MDGEGVKSADCDERSFQWQLLKALLHPLNPCHFFSEQMVRLGKCFLKLKTNLSHKWHFLLSCKGFACWGNKYENHLQTRPRCTWDESLAITACPAVHFTHRHHMRAFFPLSYHGLLHTQSNNCPQHTTNILRTCLRCGPPSCLPLLSTGAARSSCSSQRQTDIIFNNRTHT